VPNMVEGDSMCVPHPPSTCWWFRRYVAIAPARAPSGTPVQWQLMMSPGMRNIGPP